MDAQYSSDTHLFGNVTAADSVGNAVMFLFGAVLLIAIAALMVATMWKLFVKANKPGWASIVPFYNTYMMVEIAGRPTWWFAVILLVPFVGPIFSLIVVIDFVKAYGKSTAYGIASWFVPFVTYPMMAFSKDVTYVGDSVEPSIQSVYSPPQANIPPSAPTNTPPQPPAF